MWLSTSGGGARLCGVLLAASLGTAARGEDGSVRVYEATLNKLAQAIPLSRTSPPFTIWIPNPFTGAWPHECTATVSVTGVTFDIKPTGVAVKGSVGGSICGVSLPVGGSLNTTAVITYNSSNGTLRVTTTATSLRPQVTALGQSVSAPFTINVGAPLSVPPIPVRSTSFVLEAPSGARTLRLIGRDVQFSQHDGYVELEGNVTLR
jgi:hypothetical protein